MGRWCAQRYAREPRSVPAGPLRLPRLPRGHPAELREAVLRAEGPMRALVRLSLTPKRRRGQCPARRGEPRSYRSRTTAHRRDPVADSPKLHSFAHNILGDITAATADMGDVAGDWCYRTGGCPGGVYEVVTHTYRREAARHVGAGDTLATTWVRCATSGYRMPPEPGLHLLFLFWWPSVFHRAIGFFDPDFCRSNCAYFMPNHVLRRWHVVSFAYWKVSRCSISLFGPVRPTRSI